LINPKRNHTVAVLVNNGLAQSPHVWGRYCPISGIPVKWARAERESERPILPLRPWQQNHGVGKGPYLVCGFAGGKRW